MSSSMARTEKGQKHAQLASYPRRRASVGSWLRLWVGAAGWGGRTRRRQGRRIGCPTTTKTMVRIWCETSSCMCNSHCASRCRSWCRTNTGRSACSYALCRECGGAVVDAWGDRERKSRMTNKMVTTEARTIIIVRRYRWPNWSCLMSQSEPFNSAWVNPARVSCGVWPLARSIVLTQHDYFFI
jgi:hypothetical protein